MLRYLRVNMCCCTLMIAIIFNIPVLAEYTYLGKPSPNDAAAVHIYRLENGLMVYLTENHETPRFYAEIVVRVGHKQDPATNTGLAHYLEHLLFKGSKRLGTLNYQKESKHLELISQLYQQRFNEKNQANRDRIYGMINAQTQASAKYVVLNELPSLYKQMGARGLNAHTSFEETVYKIDLPINRLKHWAIIESDRFANPVFRLFAPELEVVYEEKNISMDSADRQANEALYDGLFKRHPYGQQTTLGEAEHLKNPSLEAVRDFFETYYVPNNMAIVISGAIDPKPTIELIDEHFSDWLPKNLPQWNSPIEKPLTGREQISIPFQAGPLVMMGYRAPAINDADAEAMLLADMVLANGTSGLIDLNLSQSQKLIYAGASPHQLNDYGVQMFIAVPQNGQTHEEAEELLLEQIEKLKAGDFDESIMQGIIAWYTKREKKNLESNSKRVANIRKAFLAGQDWSYVVNRFERMSRYTKQDIVDVARKYLGDGRVVVYRVPGKHKVLNIKKPEIDAVKIDEPRQSEFAKTILAEPVSLVEPTFVVEGRDYTSTRFKGQQDEVEILHVNNPTNNGLFSLEFVIETGTRHDQSLEIACRLMSQAGTAELSPGELKQAWFALGTDLSIKPSANRTTLTLSGLDGNLEASIALLMELLRTAKVAEKVRADMVENTIKMRQDAKKDPNTLAQAVREIALYDEKSQYINALSDEALRQLKTDALLQSVSDLFKYQHNIRFISSLSVEKLFEAIRPHHSIDQKLIPPPPYKAKHMEVPEETEIRVFHKPGARTLILTDIPTEIYDESLYPAAALYSQYIGGIGGVFFQELREKRALAYAVGGHYALAQRVGERNEMYARIGCQADKTLEAVTGLQNLIDNLELSPAQFDIAKESLLNSYRTSKVQFRSVPLALDSWQRRGLSSDPRPERIRVVEQAKIESLANFLKSQVSGRPKFIAIVGDTTKMKLDDLGPHLKLNLDELFSY